LHAWRIPLCEKYWYRRSRIYWIAPHGRACAQEFQRTCFRALNSMSSYGWIDSSPREIREQLEIFAGDIRDPNGVRTAMKGCDAVLHLAALIAIPYSYHSPDTYVETNIRGTLNVLQAARIRISRTSFTPLPARSMARRNSSLSPKSTCRRAVAYSATKIGADQLALSFERSFGTPVTVIRPFNTYGPGNPRARSFLPSSRRLRRSARHQARSIHPTRDFNFVADTVGGFLAALGRGLASERSSISEAGLRFRSAIPRG